LWFGDTGLLALFSQRGVVVGHSWFFNTDRRTAMTPHLNLLAFLRTGHLHTITLNHTRRDCLDALGFPDSASDSAQLWTWSIWVYGGLELHFSPANDDGTLRLWLIWCDRLPLQPSSTQQHITIDPWLFANTPGVDAQVVRDALTQANIPYTSTPPPKYSDEAHIDTLALPSGVHLGVWQSNDGASNISFIQLKAPPVV
jgi:hypothetical protein